MNTHLSVFYLIFLWAICFLGEKSIFSNARRAHKFRKNAYISADFGFRQPIARKSNNWIGNQIKKITPKSCGLKLSQNYIIGGEEAMKSEFPFMVSIQMLWPDGREHWCGGTIITNRWILTAAHCSGGKHNTIKVGAHEHTGGETYDVVKAAYHPKYLINYFKNHTTEFDILMLKTDQKIRFNSAVNAICLPKIQNSEPYNSVITVAGWGQTRNGGNGENGVPSLVLRKVDLNIISDQKCANIWAKSNIRVIRSFLCAKAIGKSACYGDSGGPAFQYVNGRAVIVGIVSLGGDANRNCVNQNPNVFTQVSYFLDWILSNIV